MDFYVNMYNLYEGNRKKISIDEYINITIDSIDNNRMYIDDNDIILKLNVQSGFVSGEFKEHIIANSYDIDNISIDSPEFVRYVKRLNILDKLGKGEY